MSMLLHCPQKNYDERAFLEEGRKGERTHRSLSLRKHRSSWHPKKFIRVDDQSHRVFIKALWVEKFSGLQDDHWLEPGYRRSSPGIVAVKVKSHVYEKREKEKRKDIQWTRTASSPCLLPPMLLKTTARSSSSSFRTLFTKTAADVAMPSSRIVSAQRKKGKEKKLTYHHKSLSLWGHRNPWHPKESLTKAVAFSSSLRELRNSWYPKKFFDHWLNPDPGYSPCHEDRCRCCYAVLEEYKWAKKKEPWCCWLLVRTQQHNVVMLISTW